MCINKFCIFAELVGWWVAMLPDRQVADLVGNLARVGKLPGCQVPGLPHCQL